MEKQKTKFAEKIKQLWENDKIRFLFTSAFNTFIGLILSFLFSFLIVQVWHGNENIKIWFFQLNLPLTISFIRITNFLYNPSSNRFSTKMALEKTGNFSFIFNSKLCLTTIILFYLERNLFIDAHQF